MDKKAVDYGTVGQYTARGLAGGIGIGGVMELIRQYKAERADDARRRARQSTSDNTIVIELPSTPARQKLAAALSQLESEVSGIPTDPQLLAEMRKQKLIGWDGSMGGTPYVEPSTQKEPWGPGTFALAGLGMMGGAYGGYKLMASIGEKYREHMLKRKLEAAKKNHMEAVMGIQQGKTAELEYIESVFDIDAQLKQADAREFVGNMFRKGTTTGTGVTPQLSDTALGALLLVTMLGAGSVGYGTKKVLDDRARLMDTEEDTAMDKPRVSRILLKSAKYGDVELDNIDAQVAMALSVLANKRDTGYLKKASVKLAAARLALTPSIIVNRLNLTDIADTVAELKQASELWSELRKPFEKQGGTLASFLAGATGNEYIRMLGDGEKKDDTDVIADRVVQRLDSRGAAVTLPEEQRQVQVEAQGPQAEAYIENNRQRLAKVIKAMAHNGAL